MTDQPTTTGAFYCTVCGKRLYWNERHLCGGTPTYCATCGKHTHFPEPCQLKWEVTRG